MAPDGRRAWSHPAGGRVVAIAWAPDGFRIAYIVHAGRRFVLHVIYGNGIHDTTIDRSVRAGAAVVAGRLARLRLRGRRRPKAIVYDFRHESRTVVPVSPPVTGVAFAPPRDASLPGGAERSLGRAPDRAAGKIAGDARGLRLAARPPRRRGPGLHTSVVRLFAPDGASRGSCPVHGIVDGHRRSSSIVRLGQSLVSGTTTLADGPAPCDRARPPGRLARPERDRDVARLGRDLRSSRTAAASRPRAPSPGR